MVFVFDISAFVFVFKSIFVCINFLKKNMRFFDYNVNCEFGFVQFVYSTPIQCASSPSLQYFNTFQHRNNIKNSDFQNENID